mmetsp:Transcript_21650/g.82379  ORF Transcript_21650/g.82379 Transcript_21650/m.82379 type:complete len:374 (-) Transcript_21650:2-1123(-)
MALLLVHARVDHIHHVVDGEGCLRDVGRKDHLHHAWRGPLEHSALLLAGHRRVKREDLRAGLVAEDSVGLQRGADGADVLPAGKEDQHGAHLAPVAVLGLAPEGRLRSGVDVNVLDQGSHEAGVDTVVVVPALALVLRQQRVSALLDALAAAPADAHWQGQRVNPPCDGLGAVDCRVSGGGSARSSSGGRTSGGHWVEERCRHAVVRRCSGVLVVRSASTRLGVPASEPSRLLAPAGGGPLRRRPPPGARVVRAHARGGVLRILVHVDETKGLAARALEEAGGVGCLISCAVVKQGSQLKGVAVPAKGRRRCGAPPAPSTASAVFEEARLFQDIGEEEARDPVRGAADEHAARACEGRRQAFSVAASGRRRGR